MVTGPWLLGEDTSGKRQTWGENSPAAAPALSQGLGGETDAILGIKLALGTSPGRWGEMELGLGGGKSGGGSREDGGEGKESVGVKLVKAHVAGSGEAEDVGVCRPGKSSCEMSER